MKTNLVFHRFPRESTGPPLRKQIYSFEGQGDFDTWPCLVVQPPQTINTELPLHASQVPERERVLSFPPVRRPPHFKGQWAEIQDRHQIGLGIVWKDLEGQGHIDFAVYPIWQPGDVDYRGPLSRERLLRALLVMECLPTIDLLHGDCRNTLCIAWGLSAPIIQDRRRSFYQENLGFADTDWILSTVKRYWPTKNEQGELAVFLHRHHVHSVR